MQKFKKNTVVRIAKDLGTSMPHFTNNCLAIVEYTYAEKYGGDDNKSYSLHIEGEGSSAWYYENQLTYVDDHGEELLKQWKLATENKRILESDWERIYDENHENLPGNTVVYLWEHIMKYGSIWGRSGEGFVAYENSTLVNEAYKYCKENNLGKENLLYCIQEFVKIYYGKG